MDDEKFERILCGFRHLHSLKDLNADLDENYVPETLESAGCTGSCEVIKDGMPDCSRCSQGKKDE
jgi:hypothetical protein